MNQYVEARSGFREAMLRERHSTQSISFVDFVKSPYYCAIDPSPVVQAIMEASEGRPVTSISDDISQAVFRRRVADIPRGRIPREVVVGAGRRGGKTSRLLAPKAIHAAWTCPVPDLAQGSKARAIIIAPRLDQAGQALDIVTGLIDRSSILSKAVVRRNKSSIDLRRPDGRVCSIQVAPASAGGGAARGPDLVFVAMDEACFLRSEGHAVNDKDIYEGLMPSLIALPPEAQVWITSTPWIEGQGLMEQKIEQCWGKDGLRPGMTLVAARVSSVMLRPNYPIEEARAVLDPDVLEREVLAIPAPKGSTSFFDDASIQMAAAKKAPGGSPDAVGAGVDLGHVNDPSALVIAKRFNSGIFSIADLIEIASRATQAPTHTYTQLKAKLRQYHIRQVAGDTAYASNFQEVLGDIALINADSKDQVYSAARDVMKEGRLCLGDLPPASLATLVAQMQQIIWKPLDGGKRKIVEPRTKTVSSTGEVLSSHMDSCSAFTRALAMVGSMDPESWKFKPKVWTGPKPGDGTGHGGHKNKSKDGYREWRQGPGWR